MARRLAIELSDAECDRLDRLVAEGLFESTEAVLHAALGSALPSPSNDQIAAAYRRAYSEVPEEEVWGKAGEELLADRLREEAR